MDLRVYIEDIHRQLAAAAEAGGDEARALAERLAASLTPPFVSPCRTFWPRPAEEITRTRPVLLSCACVAVTRVRRDAAASRRGRPDGGTDRWMGIASVEADEGGVSRINLRLPDQLKARIEQAAGAEGLSVNSWLVRAATSALDRADPGPRRPPSVGKVAQRYTGWAR